MDDIVEIPAEEGEFDSIGPLEWDEESENLAKDFAKHPKGREILSRAADMGLRDFDSAWSSGDEYRQKSAENWKIFTGDLPPKSWPFEHCANVHWPIAMETITRLVFRAFGELFGNMRNVYGVEPIGPDDEDAAKLLSQHGNYQIREQIPDFKRQMFRGMMLYFFSGDVTSHSFYDPHRKQNRHEILSPDEYCVPYGRVSTMPDWSDMPSRFRIYNYEDHELEARRDQWHGVDAVLMSSDDPDAEPTSPMSEANAQVTGMAAPIDVVRGQHKVILAEGYYDLPGEDAQRFCQILVHYESKTVLSWTVHEEPSFDEIDRFDRQLRELSAYQEATQAFDEAKGLQQQMHLETAIEPSLAPQIELPEPERPAWMDEAEPDEEGRVTPPPMEKSPIHTFAHGVCIENIMGSLGFGFGRVQSDMNRAANTMGSQFIDQATLNNAGGLIVTGNVNFKEPFTRAPGKINQVKGSGAVDLGKNIMPLPSGPANSQLMESVDKIYDRSQSAVQAPAVLSGESGKSGETFRGISARIEQATKQISVSTGLFADPFVSQIFRNNARLNGIFLNEEEFFYVNNHEFGLPSGEMLKVGRAMYRRPYTVTFRSDMQFSSQSAKTADADQLVTMGLTMMQSIQQATVLHAFLHKAFAKSLEARGAHDMVQLLGPAPPLPATPFGMMAPPGTPPPEEAEQDQQPDAPNGPAGPAPEGPPQPN